MQKISTYLWFDNNAEEAMEYYTSIFENSKIVNIVRYPESDEEHLKGMAGKVIHGIFELNGQQFMAIDGGPQFKFNEAISLYVDCQDQAEVDRLWEKLSAVPESEQCGWCKDKFGVSWQIIPKQLGELMSHPDPKKSQAVMHAMLQMKKIEVSKLQEVADNA